MTNSYLKKLITAFLILAAAVSSSSLLFLNLVPSNPPASESTESRGIRTAPIGQNAFVEQLPTITANPSSTGSAADDGLPPITPTENLTDSFAQHLAREMVAKNPNGPQVNDEGFSLNVPEDIDAIVSRIAETSPELETAIEQEARVTVSDQDILVAPDYTAEDIAVYADAINTIISENLVQSRIEAILRDAPTADALNALGVLLDLTLLQTKKLSVPAPLVPFQKSFLQVLTYQKNVLALASNQDDPLRAHLVLEASARNYEEAADRFYGELQKARSLENLSSNAPKNRFFAALRDIFFLRTKTTHAFVGFGDTSFEPVLEARSFWEFARKVLLEIFKDRLIHRLVQETIKWIQGGGKPQFITNWRAFLSGAFNEAAGLAIQDIAPGLCRSFGPLIRLNLRSVYLAPPPISCTLEQVVRNVEDFYNDFSQGGWIGYGALVLPSGNYFGSLYEVNLTVLQRAEAAKEEAKSKGESSGGFKPQERCVKTRFVNKYQECVFENPSRIEVCRLIPNVTEEVCEKYQVTTPGSTLEGITVAALNSPISRIVNAQDIAALTSAFVNAALNRLIKLGQKGISGLFGGGGGGGGGSPGSPPTPPDFSAFCPTLDESIAEVKRFRDFAQANRGQLEGGFAEPKGGRNGENFFVAADATIWSNRAQDTTSPVSGLMNTVTGFKNPQWDPLELQLGRFSNWLDAITTSLIKDEDLDLDGPWNKNNPPTQGVQGVIRMTGNFTTYLETVKRVTGGTSAIMERYDALIAGRPTIKESATSGQFTGDIPLSCTGGGGGEACADPGNSVANYAGDLQTALNAVIADNPSGIADLPYTRDNGITFLNFVAQKLRAAGFNATTDVLNGNGNLNPSGDLIAVWKSGDSIRDCKRLDPTGLGGIPDPKLGGGGTPGGECTPPPPEEQPASLFSDVQGERARYGPTISQAEAGEILNAIAWNNRSAGWGLSGKTFGNRCPSPAGEIACDILHHRPTNIIVDVLGSAPDNETPNAPANPQWSVLCEQTDPNRPWVAPVQP